jgi:PE family
MSYVLAAPDMLAAAATDVAGIGSSLSAANSAAIVSTTAVVTAAEDEVSAAIAALFSGHGQSFQALSAQAASFHTEFVQALSGARSAYAAAEAANVSLLAAALRSAKFEGPVELLTGARFSATALMGRTVRLAPARLAVTAPTADG